MKVVGFCGLAGSGKNTAAAFLQEYGYNCIAFADPLREALLRLDPIVIASHGKSGISPSSGLPITWCNRLSKLVDAVGWDEAKKSSDVRTLLQVFGTEIVREMFGYDAWVDLAQQRMEDMVLDGLNAKFAITDLRFSNELDMIKSYGGLVVCITGGKSDPSLPVMQHKSEQFDYKKHADFIINNDGTLEDLRDQVLDVCGIQLKEALEV